VPYIKGEMDRIGAASPQIPEATWSAARSSAKEAIDAWHRETRRVGRGSGGDGTVKTPVEHAADDPDASRASDVEIDVQGRHVSAREGSP
jgi:hypothetical protein